MSRRGRIPTFDADSHFYETAEAFTRYLPEEFAGAIRYVEIERRTKIVIRGKISETIPNPTFEVVGRPGAQEEYFRNGNPEGKSYRELMGEPMRSIPAFREPGPRLETMDEQGVDQSLMFPTAASLLEERMRDDAELTHAAIHALNQWIHETWTFNYEDRIFAVPVITLPIIDRAIEELEWCLERGARIVLVRPAPVPVPGHPRSFALPHFDRFWERVVEADIPVAIHSSDSGYGRMQAEEWTGPGEWQPTRRDPFVMMTTRHRPAIDTATSMACHGLLSRFPDQRFVFVENGGKWVAPFLRDLADTYKKVPNAFVEDPVEAFRRNCWISPFFEDDFTELFDAMGVENICFGSDWPHPEGLAEPWSYVDHLPDDLGDAEIAAIMGGNLSRAMKVGVPA
jgi:predicted TIM-barrel fold metal-dependent hydrolase